MMEGESILNISLLLRVRDLHLFMAVQVMDDVSVHLMSIQTLH